jgi:hypothetical protein
MIKIVYIENFKNATMPIISKSKINFIHVIQIAEKQSLD